MADSATQRELQSTGSDWSTSRSFRRNPPVRQHPQPKQTPLRLVPPGEKAGLNSPPPGRWLDLGRRGRTWIREHQGPEGAPTLLLLHGLGATGGLNWSGSQLFLGDRFHLVTIDHRGHGRGIRTKDFHLEDCADDAAATIQTLGIERPIVVGYSMGGPIASLLWKRHPHLVGGLVFCATSRNFRGTPGEKLAFGAFGVAGLTPAVFPGKLVRGIGGMVAGLPLPEPGLVKDVTWAVEEFSGHDPRAVLQAAAAIGRFDSSSWIGEVDVPTSVVVTTADQVVPTMRQFRLARAIRHASVHCVDAGHLCVKGGETKSRFYSTLRDACLDVAAAALPGT
jgi:3-oxoadipate enol-lactonase